MLENPNPWPNSPPCTLRSWDQTVARMPCLNRNPNPRIRWRLWLIWVEFDSQFIVEVDSGENGRIPAHGWHLEAPNRGSPALICGEEWRKPGWWWLAVHKDHRGPSQACQRQSTTRRRCPGASSLLPPYLSLSVAVAMAWNGQRGWDGSRLVAGVAAVDRRPSLSSLSGVVWWSGGREQLHESPLPCFPFFFKMNSNRRC